MWKVSRVCLLFFSQQQWRRTYISKTCAVRLSRKLHSEHRCWTRRLQVACISLVDPTTSLHIRVCRLAIFLTSPTARPSMTAHNSRLGAR